MVETVDPGYLKRVLDWLSADKPLEHYVASGRKLVVPEPLLVVVPGQLWAVGDVEVYGELVVV